MQPGRVGGSGFGNAPAATAGEQDAQAVSPQATEMTPLSAAGESAASTSSEPGGTLAPRSFISELRGRRRTDVDLGSFVTRLGSTTRPSATPAEQARPLSGLVPDLEGPLRRTSGNESLGTPGAPTVARDIDAARFRAMMSAARASAGLPPRLPGPGGSFASGARWLAAA